jgi:hypothetical protein
MSKYGSNGLGTEQGRFERVVVSSPAELLLSELRGKIDGQLATLESLRTRAAVALSVAGVIAGLFGQRLDSHPGNWVLAAIAAFLAGAIPAVWILAPHKMTIAPKADDWIRFAVEHEAWSRQQLTLNAERRDPESEGDVGAAQLAAQMVTSMADWYKHNEPTLKWAHKAILVAFVAVVVQLACWSGSIIGS